MKVQDSTAAWLSNYEVLDHLTKQKERREKLNSELKHPPRTAGNIMTIEYEVSEFQILIIFGQFYKTLSYLNGTPSKHLSGEKLRELMEYLLQFSLTKAEKLQIINLLPRSPVELYLVCVSAICLF